MTEDLNLKYYLIDEFCVSNRLNRRSVLTIHTYLKNEIHQNLFSWSMSAPSRTLLFSPWSTKLVSSQGSAMRNKK
jgi:hypothetical protein